MSHFSEELSPKIEDFSKKWATIYEINRKTPEVFTPYLKNITIDDVGTTVLIVLEWLKKTNFPRNEKFVYKISKQITLDYLVQSLNFLDDIISGKYDKIYSFVKSISFLLTSMFPVTYLNSHDTSSAALSADLSEAVVNLEKAENKLQEMENMCQDIFDS